MRLAPRSLFGRLLATAGIALLAALAFAAVSIGHVLERFVMHGLDERLDAQIEVVARAVRPDGGLDAARAVDVPPFDRPGSGWAWEIVAPGGTLRSASLGSRDIAPPDRPPPIFEHHHRDDRLAPRPFDGIDGDGAAIHGRMLALPTAAGEARIVATGPRRVVDRPLRAAITPLLLSLLLLGGGLTLAILVQLRIGLRPVAALGAMVAEVRAGRRRHVDTDAPTELLPLVAELNALIDANEAALAGARGHVANLAHGLKTPLAALRLDLDRPGRDPDGLLARHVERIDGQIRHHLGRARAASPGGAGRVATPIAPHVDDLVAVLARIHADRAIRADVAIPADLAVQCDPQDLDEMLGALLDNAWRWARSTVRVTGARRAGTIEISLLDDGPGLPEGRIPDALTPGGRLDEAGDGHGFGLSIARDLAALYGGALALANDPPAGLRVTLTLAAARPA